MYFKCFNSTKVQLEQLDHLLITLILSFNSTKVQLEPKAHQTKKWSCLFQFH